MGAPLSIRLDEELSTRLGVAALREDEPPAQVASRAITAWLDARDELDRQLSTAVEKAKRGGPFVSSERMGEWIRSWGTDAEGPPPAPDIFPAGHDDA